MISGEPRSIVARHGRVNHASQSKSAARLPLCATLLRLGLDARGITAGKVLRAWQSARAGPGCRVGLDWLPAWTRPIFYMRGRYRLYRCSAQPSTLPIPSRFYRSTGVKDRQQASQRVILQLGRAFWSLATPAAVTLVPTSKRSLSWANPCKVIQRTSEMLLNTRISSEVALSSLCFSYQHP